MEKILFVCTGNTCRSPMAEYYTNYYLKENNLDDKFLAISAGLSIYPNDPASSNTIKIMKDMGLDLSMHTSSRLDGDMMGEAEYIFVMTVQHEKLLKDAFPEHKSKIFLLGNGIEDPYGHDLSAYEQARNDIEGQTRNIVQKLKKLVDNTGL